MGTRSPFTEVSSRVIATAGFGDIGFSGNWTLEIDVVQPVKIYAGIEICQIFYHTTLGGLTKTYKGKYQGSKLPLPSAIWKEFQQE
jgi:dCTP deaminase